MIRSVPIPTRDRTAAQTIRTIQCDVCGRTDTQTNNDGANAFPGWTFDEGENRSPWHVCPNCSRIR